MRSRRLWLTGASAGIGRATALRFAADGWHVAVSARTEADLMSLREEAEPLAGAIEVYPLDVRDEEAVVSTYRAIEDDLGSLDLVLPNAGTHRALAAKDVAVAPFRDLMEINFFGTVNVLAAVLPRFLERRAGHIAVVASMSGYRGLPTASAYGASKAALINMAEALKPELDGAGVKLQLINPGFVKTPLTDRNEFPMPFLISAEEAAERIFRGVHRDAFEIAFPTRFALIMGLLRMMPDRLLFAITRRMIRS